MPVTKCVLLSKASTGQERVSGLERQDIFSTPAQASEDSVRPCPLPIQTVVITYQKAKHHSGKEAPNEAFPGLLRGELQTETHCQQRISL